MELERRETPEQKQVMLRAPPFCMLCASDGDPFFSGLGLRRVGGSERSGAADEAELPLARCDRKCRQARGQHGKSDG
ncbi:hypothetical protein VCV18_002186 [Metarhizium anisopliae]